MVPWHLCWVNKFLVLLSHVHDARDGMPALLSQGRGWRVSSTSSRLVDTDCTLWFTYSGVPSMNLSDLAFFSEHLCDVLF